MFVAMFALCEPLPRDEQSMMAATVINCRDCLVHDTGREIRTFVIILDYDY